MLAGFRSRLRKGLGLRAKGQGLGAKGWGQEAREGGGTLIVPRRWQGVVEGVE